MANEDLMKLTIKPLLTIAPASIAGTGDTFEISFAVVDLRNIDEFQVKYRILNAAGYLFKAPAATDFPIFYQVSDDGLIADGFLGDPPKKGKWTQRAFIAGDASQATAAHASLKIAASVNGVGKKGTLRAVHATGSIAILTGGLKKLVNDHFATHEVPAGITDFEGKARAFVNQKKKELKGRFAAFDKLDARTIVNAVMGKTDPQERTVESLSEVIKHFKKNVEFPAEFADEGKNTAER